MRVGPGTWWGGAVRLFVAVLPPEPPVAELARAVAPLRDLPGADALRWTARADWHFTLAFLGEVDEPLLPDLTARLARGARRCEPFDLCLSGGGRFGDDVLWAGVAGGVPELRRLADRARAAASRAGVDLGGPRPYRPHLTLARARTGPGGDARGGDGRGGDGARRRGGTDLRPYADALGAFRGTPWRVTDCALVRSHLPGGHTPGARPRYEVLVRCPLGRAAGGGGDPGT